MDTQLGELPMKRCVKCKEFKLLTEYCNNKYSMDGLYWVCNDCKKEFYTLPYIKPITCECGRMVNKPYLSRHLKTEIHKKYLDLNFKNNNE